MRSLLAAAQRAAARQPADALIVLTAAVGKPAPPVDVLLRAGALGPPLFFAPGSWAGGSELRVIGFGQTARVVSSGTSRLESLQSQGAALLGRIVELRDPDCEDAPAPRLYGGLRFAPIERADAGTVQGGEPWSEFPDASFDLARWMYAQRDGRGYLQLAVHAAALRDGARLGQELAVIEEALRSAAHGGPPARLAPPLEHIELAPCHWQALVHKALAEISAGQLSKVILARQSVVRRMDGVPFDVRAALLSVGSQYPECTRFALPVAGAVFLGATPEVLVARTGDYAAADALAGSYPRPPADAARTAGEDSRSISALLADDKERREHAHVVDFIAERLAAFSDEVCVGPGPKVRSLRNVHHLWTPVSARLRRPRHVLELLSALHPTPAVCGVPQQAAERFVMSQEPTPRGFYSAPVGWFDARGDGAFHVAIRSAVIKSHHAWLFAGAGIVAGSDPDREYRETAAKLRPMLTALGALP